LSRRRGEGHGARSEGKQRAAITIADIQPTAESNTMKLPKNPGMLLLGIWLVLTGLIPLFNLSFSGLGLLMQILAIAAGALILFGR